MPKTLRPFRNLLPIMALLLAIAACRPDPGTDAFVRKNYMGRWDLELLSQTFSQPGHPDSLSSLSEGYFVLDLDETFDDNPFFIEEDFASQWQMLAPLLDADLIPLSSTGLERRAFWRQDEEQGKFSIWNRDGSGAIQSAVAELEREGDKITLYYEELGGPQGERTLSETLVLVKD